MSRHALRSPTPTDTRGLHVRPTPSDLAVLGHELRAPLGAIRTLVELLIERSHNEADANALGLIRLAAEQAITVSENYTATPGGTRSPQLRPAEVDPVALARDVAAMFAPALEQAGREITLSVDKATPRAIVTDPVRLRQILFNLLSNAVRASSAGNLELRISRAATRMRLLFEVTDHGLGLPDGFSIAPYNTGGRPGGTGLGLWISARLARSLGGRLDLSPGLNGGTIASLTVHRALDRLRSRLGGRRSKAPGAPSIRSADAAAERPASDGIRALVVDDSPVACMLMTTILESFDVQVDVAASAEEAVERSAGGSPHDIVFLDWSLRQENGTDVLDALDATTGGKLPPVVVTSARDEPPHDRRISGFLRKPFTPRELYGALTEILSESAESKSG